MAALAKYIALTAAERRLPKLERDLLRFLLTTFGPNIRNIRRGDWGLLTHWLVDGTKAGRNAFKDFCLEHELDCALFK